MITKKTILLFLCFVCLHTYAQQGSVVLGGKIRNAHSKNIFLKAVNGQALTITKLDDNGYFNMNPTISGGYYRLYYSQIAILIYLHPKDRLTITFDACKLHQSIHFTGIGSARNNYLAEKYKLIQKIRKGPSFFDAGEASYFNQILKVHKKVEGLLKKYKVKPFFKEAEKKSLHYDDLLALQYYKQGVKSFLGKDIQPSKRFYRPLKNLNLEKTHEYEHQPNYRKLVNSIWFDHIKNAESFEAMKTEIEKIQSQKVALSMIKTLYRRIAFDPVKAKDYYKLIKTYVSNEELINKAKKRLEKYQRLETINELPKFNFENRSGKKVNLKDFRGKWVYLDIWATWCAPCLAQVPALKKLEGKFAGKNIVFVSISINKAKAKWKKMVKSQKLGGIQLIADKGWKSRIIKDFEVKGIPRFMIIAPSGKIYSPDAPLPSFPTTEKLLNQLLKN